MTKKTSNDYNFW